MDPGESRGGVNLKEVIEWRGSLIPVRHLKATPPDKLDVDV